MKNSIFIKRAYDIDQSSLFIDEKSSQKSKGLVKKSESITENLDMNYKPFFFDDVSDKKAKDDKQLTNMLNGAITAPAYLYAAKHVPGNVASVFWDKPGSSRTNNAYKVMFDKQILKRLPLVKDIKTHKGRFGAALTLASLLGAGVGAMNNNSSSNTIKNENKPNWVSSAKDTLASDSAKDLYKTLGYTGGGALLGTLLGSVLKGDKESNLLPIVLGLLGAGSGYMYKNKDNLNLKKLFNA